MEAASHIIAAESLTLSTPVMRYLFLRLQRFPGR